MALGISKYTPVTSTSGRYTPVSSDTKSTQKKVLSTIDTGLNAAGQAAFFSNPYQSASNLPMSSATKPSSIFVPKEAVMSTILPTNTSGSTPSMLNVKPKPVPVGEKLIAQYQDPERIAKSSNPILQNLALKTGTTQRELDMAQQEGGKLGSASALASMALPSNAIGQVAGGVRLASEIPGSKLLSNLAEEGKNIFNQVEDITKGKTVKLNETDYAVKDIIDNGIGTKSAILSNAKNGREITIPVDDLKELVTPKPELRAPLTETTVPKGETLQETILKAKKNYDKEQRSNITPPDPIEFPQEVTNVRESMAKSPIVDNISDYKDISNAKVQFRDIYRNTRQVFGKDSAVADEILLEPFNQAKGRYIDFLNKETAELADNIKIRANSKESKYVRLYGEGKVTREELVNKFGEDKTLEIIEADNFFRTKYDQLLGELNKIEQQIYPNSPYKWTPKKTNYYRHAPKAGNDFSRLQNILEKPTKIDPLLVGISETTEPKSKWASFKQARHTETTESDAVGGYIDYLKSIGYAIHIDPQIGRIREFTEVLKRGTGVKKNLNNYIQNLTNFANELSGKTHLLDRAVMEVIPGGRKGLSVLTWLNNRVKANTILLNVKSSLAQILNLPQALATAGPINSAKGATMALAQIFKTGPMSKSTFIKERYFRGFNKFDKGILENTKKFASWMIGVLDEVATKTIWNGQYAKAVNLGEKNPIKFADDATRSLVAGRGIGEKPSIQNSQTFQLLAPFQYEMTNVWWVMEDIAKNNPKMKDKIGQFMTFFVYVYLMDNIFESITGGRPLLDPIEAVSDGIKEIKADKGVAGWTKAGGRLFGEVVTNIPGGQFLGSVYPEFGFTVAGAKMPSRKEFFGSADPTRFGEGLLSTKALSDPLFKIAPPYGGAQLKKTLQGLSTVDKGKSTNTGGKFEHKVEQSLSNYITGSLFGKYGLPESKAYYKKKEEKASKTKNSTQRANRYTPL